MQFVDKKILLLLMVVGLVACGGKDHPAGPEVPDVPEQGDRDLICFFDQLVDMSENTRATQSLTTTGNTTFSVWAVKTTDMDGEKYTNPQNVINNYKVEYMDGSAGTSSTNTTGWEYAGLTSPTGTAQTPKYWDYSATSYRFFAAAPAASYTTREVNETADKRYIELDLAGLDGSSDEGIAAAPYFSRLCFTNNNSENLFYGKTVPLSFLKPFCQVTFRFIDIAGNPLTINTDESDTENYGKVTVEETDQGYTIKEIKLSSNLTEQKLSSEGTLTIHYPTCGTAKEQYYTSTPAEGKVVDALTEPDYTYNLLPYTDPNLQNSFVMTLKRGDKSLAPAYVPAQYMQWYPNNKYTYVFKLTDKEVEFIDVLQVGITEWKTEPGNHEIYNW